MGWAILSAVGKRAALSWRIGVMAVAAAAGAAAAVGTGVGPGAAPGGGEPGIVFAAAAPEPVERTWLGVTWELREEDLGDTVRVYDPQAPLLTGYRPTESFPTEGRGPSALPPAWITYWFYEGQLARIHILPMEGKLPEDLPLPLGLDGGRMMWEAVGPDGLRLRIDHPERMGEARSAAAALPARERDIRFLEALREGALSPAYRDLLRRADLYDGAAVRYRGWVIQVVADGVWRIGVVAEGSIGAGNPVYVEYRGTGNPKLAADETVEVLGLARGIFRYVSRLGTDVTLPRILAYRVKPEE